MRTLHIDIETYSSVDLGKSGLYKYVESPDFTILLFGYAYDDEDIKVVDLAQGENIPNSVISDIIDPNVLKLAHNAAFEINALQRHLGVKLDIRQWQDTMIMAYYLSLPGSLANLGKILKTEEQKQASGTMLINFFSKPCKPTKTNGGRTRNLPAHDLEKWQLYKKYNAQDVRTERDIHNFLKNYHIPEKVWDEWALDLKINACGVGLDLDFVNNAVRFAENRKIELEQVARELTGLENPNSPAQLKEWLSEVEGYSIDSIAKSAELNVQTDEAKKMMEIRSELGKSSVSKYDTMLACAGEDGRARGLLQFYGTHTGRWAGRLIQVQNLPRNYMKNINDIRSLVKLGDYELFKMLVDDPMDTLSQLSRTAFIPSANNKLIIADYSSIEARIISWLAKEEWQIEVFKTTGKIYESTASKMFNVPLEEVDRDLRQKGKVASLALGYQGAAGALKQMGALNMGLTEEELPAFVARWRRANPNIVKLWADVESCARKAIKEKGVRYSLPQNEKITFTYSQGLLEIALPSGRSLMYPNAGLDEGRLYYMGYPASKNVWSKIQIYGGLLTENIVQAIARDALSDALTALDKEGYRIVFHVHDEVIIDAPKNVSMEDVIKVATKKLQWAHDLYLTMEGFEADFYQKD